MAMSPADVASSMHCGITTLAPSKSTFNGYFIIIVKGFIIYIFFILNPIILSSLPSRNKQTFRFFNYLT